MKGFSLLEILIAFLILSLGLLTIAGWLTSSLRYNYSVYLNSIASAQITSMFDRLQTGNPQQQLLIWNQSNAQLLPEGQGQYNRQEIKLCWFDRFANHKVCLKND